MPPKAPKKKQGVHGFGGSLNGRAKVTKLTKKFPSQVTPSSGTKRKIGQTLSGETIYEADSKSNKRAKTKEVDEAAYEPSDEEIDVKEDDAADEEYVPAKREGWEIVESDDEIVWADAGSEEEEVHDDKAGGKDEVGERMTMDKPRRSKASAKKAFEKGGRVLGRGPEGPA